MGNMDFCDEMRGFFSPLEAANLLQNKGVMRLCKKFSDCAKKNMYIVFIHVIIRNDIFL
jgi:hypothetical protein